MREEGEECRDELDYREWRRLEVEIEIKIIFILDLTCWSIVVCGGLRGIN